MNPPRATILALLTAAGLLGQPRNLDRDLARFLKANKLPGAVAVVFTKDSVLDTGAAGVREVGKPALIGIDDQFHIGSNAKAMLATVVGTLVEAQKISWDSPVADSLKLDQPNGFSGVTLAQLLDHHSGLPAFEDEDSREWKSWVANRQATAPAITPVQRFARWIFTQPPVGKPGTSVLYSNAGYVAVAAIAESVTGEKWQGLLASRLFAPLGMNAGFGLPAAADSNQPQGHYETKNALKVQDAKETIPPFVQPAGNVRLSVGNYVKFLQLHLKGLQGEDGLLSAATIRRMHVPVDKMAFGWKISDFAGQPASFHAGSADTFYAFATLLPTRNLGVVILVNAGGDRAEKASLAATKELLARFTKSGKSR